MRQLRLWMVAGLLGLVVTACEKETATVKVIDFEDVDLATEGFFNGSDKSGTLVNGSYLTFIKSSSVELVNEYAESEWGGFWKGFAVSSMSDTQTPGYENQYSSIAGSGAGSSLNFALAYASTGDSAVIHLNQINSSEKTDVIRPKQMMITNSTYTYFTLRDGNAFSQKFESGDWFRIIVRGFDQTNETGKVEFYLADFREGKSVIVNEWTTVSLTALGTPDRLVITFDSSDKSAGWINTPAYACIDNLEISYSDN